MLRIGRMVAVFLGIAFAFAACQKARPRSVPLKVAAASDLALAFRDLGPIYEKETGQPVVLSFASTGMLEKQVADGAPFDVFAAANAQAADDAVAAGACIAGSQTRYATGRLVLYAARGAPVAPKTLAELTDSRITKVAIANPKLSPHGHASKEALERAGIWDLVSSKVVYADSAQQTMQFVESRAVDVAIVALSLAIASPGTWTLVPAEMHDPIDQVMVACTHGPAGPAAARRFIEFVLSDAAQTVMRKYGLQLYQ